MTEKKRLKIREAINRFCDDDGWQDGIDILKSLLNPDYKNPFEGMKRVKYVDVAELKEEEPRS